MLDLLIVILFVWLFIKVIGLAFKAVWGTAKVVASLLLGLAVPLLAFGVMFAGGLVLLIPVAMIAIAFGLLKKCV